MKPNKNITILTIPSNKGCRQAIDFFKSNGIEYTERNVLSQKLTIEEISELVKNYGLSDLFATKSKDYLALQAMLENDEGFKMSQLYQFIRQNPKVLRFPLIYDRKRKILGFNEEKIRAFLPRHIKTNYFLSTLEALETHTA